MLKAIELWKLRHSYTEGSDLIYKAKSVFRWYRSSSDNESFVRTVIILFLFVSKNELWSSPPNFLSQKIIFLILHLGNDPFPEGNLIIGQEEELHRNKMPSAEDLSTALCDSCLKISKNSKEFLSLSSLSNEVGNLGNIFCHLMPTDSEKKVRKLSSNALRLLDCSLFTHACIFSWYQCEMIAEMYEHKGTMFLQELFHDENFCTNKGFCQVNSQSRSIPTPGETQIHHIGEHLNSVLSTLENGLPVDVTTVFNSTAYLPNLKPTIQVRWNTTFSTCILFLVNSSFWKDLLTDQN